MRNLTQGDQRRGRHPLATRADRQRARDTAADRESADALLDLPQTEATETAADIPALLQGALDYITTNKTGRTDVWLLSDLQQSDWDASGGRWETLRSAFATLQGVRFHLLCYPEPAPDDLAISVERVMRRETSEKAELLLDLRITRQADRSAADRSAAALCHQRRGDHDEGRR